MRRHPFAVLTLILLAAAVATLVAACQPLPDRSATPMARAAMATPEPATPTPEPGVTPPPVVTARPAKPTATIPVLPPPEDDDCSSCKREPEVRYTDILGRPQPLDHFGRTACLSCHKSPAQPALPATHIDRDDTTCARCHATPLKARAPLWHVLASLVRVHRPA